MTGWRNLPGRDARITTATIRLFASRIAVRVAAEERDATFRLGDRVRVRAERIDPFRHRVEFSLIEDLASDNR